MLELQLRCQVDSAAGVEEDSPRCVVATLESPAQRAFDKVVVAAIVQTGDIIDLAATGVDGASSGGKAAPAFGTRKGYKVLLVVLQSAKECIDGHVLV